MVKNMICPDVRCDVVNCKHKKLHEYCGNCKSGNGAGIRPVECPDCRKIKEIKEVEN